jgi:hypothetical protein
LNAALNLKWFAALGLAAALSGCYPPGYNGAGCYTVCNAPYHPTYAYVSGPAIETPFDDPFADYTQRIVTVSTTAGNAIAANTALQTATPWPRNSSNTNIPGNGARMVKAIQNFESGTVPPLPLAGGGGAGGAATTGGAGGAGGAGAGGAPTGGAGGAGGGY